MVQDHAVDADFGGHHLVGKETVLRAVVAYNLHFVVDGKLLNSIFWNAAVLAFFAQAIALVTLLIRDTAGTGSLLGFAGCADEAFPILFFLRGDFDPLAEGAVLTEFSVSDCSKPAQKAATVLNYLHLPVEPSGIS